MFKKGLDWIRFRLKAKYYIFINQYNSAIKYLIRFFQEDCFFPKRLRMTNYDVLLTKLGEKIFKKHEINLVNKKVSFSKTKVLILNTEIYDTGGHTELALRFADSFKNDFDIYFLLAGYIEKSEDIAPEKSKIIREKVKEFVELSSNITFEEKVIKIYGYILQNEFTTIIVNIHMYDVVSSIVLGLVKKYTNINIVFWNHADHSFSLATSFADSFITRLKDQKPLLNYLRTQKNSVDFLFLEKSNDKGLYSQEEIDTEKQRLGIKSNSFITLTGAPDYKIFSDKKQPYLKLIRRLLDANPQLVHILIGSSYCKNQLIIDKIIGKELIDTKRLVFIDRTSNFDLYICLADLYIDSFPQGSALTLLDCSRNSKPAVVKINLEAPEKSFQMYMADDYKYSCKTPDEMFNKINKLINDNAEYNIVANEVRKNYIKKYAIDIVKEKYLELIK